MASEVRGMCGHSEKFDTRREARAIVAAHKAAGKRVRMQRLIDAQGKTRLTGGWAVIWG